MMDFAIMEQQIINQPTILTDDYSRCQQEFEILLDSGFFHFRNGVAVCHRDGNGVLRKVEVTQAIFNK